MIDDKDFLATLKIGSVVKINEYYGSGFTLVEITGETKTTFKFGNNRSFKKDTGYVIGSCHGIRTSWVERVTEKDLECVERKKLVTQFMKFNTKDLTNRQLKDVLNFIKNLLEENKHKEKEE